MRCLECRLVSIKKELINGPSSRQISFGLKAPQPPKAALHSKAPTPARLPGHTPTSSTSSTPPLQTPQLTTRHSSWAANCNGNWLYVLCVCVCLRESGCKVLHFDFTPIGNRFTILGLTYCTKRILESKQSFKNEQGHTVFNKEFLWPGIWVSYLNILLISCFSSPFITLGLTLNNF